MTEYRFGDICKVINGRAYRQPELLDSGKYPVLRVGNFFSSDRWFYSDLELPEDKYCDNGDLLFAWSASFGPRIWDGGKVIYHYHIWKLEPDEAVVDKHYLHYWLCKSVNILTAGTHGSVMAHMTKGDMENQRILLPNLEVQRRVGTILRILDDKIELNNKINENLERQAFALFDRLMIEAGNSDCLVSEIAYLNPKRSLSKNEVARYIDMSQLSTSGAFPSGWKMKPFTGGMRFSNGDTLLARITPCLENGKTAYIDFLDNKEVAFGSTEYIVLAPKEGIPPEYLYCLARYPAFVDYAVKNMNGSSGRQRVSADIIGQFVMPRPSERNLRDFGSIVSALFMKMKNNSLENIRLASLRDSLLPKLMSGEIDVSALQI